MPHQPAVEAERIDVVNELYMCRLELAECKETLAAERDAMEAILEQPHIARAIALEAATNSLRAELVRVSMERDHAENLVRHCGGALGLMTTLLIFGTLLGFFIGKP